MRSLATYPRSQKWYEAIKRSNTTHGCSHLPEYRIWWSMRQRCYLPSHTSYQWYGARGIKVSQEWESFEVFFRDMGPRPSPEYSIERKDNDGDYSKQNCLWVLKPQQARNTRRSQKRFSAGDTVGLWTVISGPTFDSHSNTKYFCRCECGCERHVNGQRLLDGESRSCGCRIGRPGINH